MYCSRRFLAGVLFVLLWNVPLPTVAAAPAAKPVAPAAVDALFSTWNRADSPGCAVGVMRAGRLVLARGYGRARLPDGPPLTPRSGFLVGSTSKQFTAATVLRLALDGKLALDAPAVRYLPELGPVVGAVTLRQMLHHQSGLPDYLGLAALRGDYPPRLDDGVAPVLRQLAGLGRLNFPPGSQFAYSNTNYLLLGEVVRRVAGQSFGQEAERALFRPLGMGHSFFYDDPQRKAPELATGYLPGPDGPRAAPLLAYPGGDGGLVTTIEDLARWDGNFYHDRLGSHDRSVVAEMLRPGELSDGRSYDFAAGLFLGRYRGLATVSHPGSEPGFRAELLRFPEQKLTVACLCNLLTINAAEQARRVADLYLKDVFPEPPVQTSAMPKAELDQLAGLYLHPELGPMQVEVDDAKGANGRLVVLVHGVGLPAAAPVGGGRFRSLFTPLPVEVVFTANGGARGVRLEWPGEPAADFERLEPVTLPASALDALAGTYESTALDVSWRIERRKEGLVALLPGQDAEPLTPLAGDRLRLEDFLLTLDRDGDGAVTGFTVDTVGDRGIRFARAPEAAARLQ